MKYIDGNQFNLLVDILGTPTEEEIEHVPRIKAREYLYKLPKAKPKPLESIFTNASPLGMYIHIL